MLPFYRGYRGTLVVAAGLGLVIAAIILWICADVSVPARAPLVRLADRPSGPAASSGEEPINRVSATLPSSALESALGVRVRDGAELVVRCAAKGPLVDMAIDGIAVSLWSMDGVRVSDVRVSESGGLATFVNPAPGSYQILARDPRKVWSLAESAEKKLTLQLPASVVTLDFVPYYVACFRFQGDEILAYRTGRNPEGFGPDPANTSEHGEDGVCRFLYRQLEGSVFEALPVVEIVAFGKHHGECRFTVPLYRADLGAAPVSCDMGSFPLRPAVQVVVSIVDSARSPAGIDSASFHSDGHLLIPWRPGEECWLPLGFAYNVKVGRFPIEWRSKKKKTVIDARAPTNAPIQLNLQLPVVLVEKDVVVSVNGEAVPPGERFSISASGNWGDPEGTFGIGGLSHFTSGSLGAMWLPTGRSLWRMRAGGKQYEATFTVASEGRELIVDFRR